MSTSSTGCIMGCLRLQDLKLEPEGGDVEGEGAAAGLGEEALLEARPDTRNVLAVRKPPAGSLLFLLAPAVLCCKHSQLRSPSWLSCLLPRGMAGWPCG